MKIVARLPLFAALLGLLMLPMAGIGVRLGWWNFGFGFQMLEWGAWTGLIAAACGAIAFAIPRVREDFGARLMLAIMVGVMTGGIPWQQKQQAKALPKIHDISTDLSNPPPFVKILPLRASAPNPATYGGALIAAAQMTAYPDIQPRELALPPTTAFVNALAAAVGMGWEIVATDPEQGIIEATATTFWFGFKDDVVIRITPTLTGSRVDMRSVSRVGKSDVGANAARIRQYFSKMQAK